MDVRKIDCPICEREVDVKDTTEHHLVPKSKKGKEKVAMCIACHKMLHKLISNKDMAKIYNTIEKLREHEGVQNWVEWVSKRKKVNVTTATKKRKRK